MKRVGAALVLGLIVAFMAVGCVQQAQNDVNQIDPAQDVAAQAALTQAANAARTATTETGSFAGFNATAARAVEPTLVWADNAAATNGQISIRGASATGVVLVTKSESGNVLCMGITPAGQTMGKQDVVTPGQCTGGW